MSSCPTDDRPSTAAGPIERSSQSISPWVSLESVTAMVPGQTGPSVYHAIGQADYIQVLCQHENGGIVLIRQYRPVVDQWTTEFPGGLREGDEHPATAARREVEEESGLTVVEIIPLIETYADVGRLTNRWFGFFAIVTGEPKSVEAGVEPRLVDGREIHRLAASGGLSIPGNIALLYLAASHAAVRDACLKRGIVHPAWKQT